MATRKLWAGLIAAIAALAVAGASASTGKVFHDGRSEVTGAPDITDVKVTQDGSVLTVDAEVSDMLQLGTRGTTLFMLNTDGDRTTGDVNGAEYLLFWDSKTFATEVQHWNG